VRIILDPGERERAKARRLQEAKGFARALAAHRRRHGLRQSDIPGLSERQIRRYEHGARIPLPSLELLARAHGLDVSTFLDEVVEEAK
jgi:transcriptional regulator with XRE-family HTH domain